MSKEIDEKVVEMRFDNSQFESNVKTTMSTLERLKAALKFPSKVDGLNALSSGAKTVTSNINGVNSSVGTLRASFSALEVMGVTALANITNQAVNAGKRLANALTLQPLTSGFQEYETQMNAIQTILSNTQSKGTTIDDVTAALDELNEYADKTIYNFTEMTKNIGTFTAAGLGLEESVSAIKGIANLAAVSGSTSNQASVAMYQLSQALANGRVSLMDWNSVVNAGMGGEVFQEALKRTARNMGEAVDEAIEKYGSFRESLTKGQWLTTEVLSETLAQIAGAYNDEQLAAQGYTEDQIRDIQLLAQNAEDAATKVTTFTKLLDTLGEALGSGWTTTWETIFGDFYEARDFWTGISESLGELINASAEARNELLGGAFDSPWQKVEEQIINAGGSFAEFQQKIQEVAKEHNIAIDSMIDEQGDLQSVIESGAIGSDIILEAFSRLAGGMTGASESTEDLTSKLEEMQKVVDQVWRGDFGNGAKRVQELSDAGYDYAEVQELVNKTVDGHRLTLDDLSDSQLENIGYTNEQIETLRELQKQAEQTGTPINELLTNMSKPSGRELFFQSIRNILSAIITPMQAFGEAWSSIFTIDSGDIYKALEAFEEFTSGLIIGGDNLTNLSRTIRGVLSALRILAKFLGGGASVAFNALSKALGIIGPDFLKVTGQIGDWIVELDKSLNSSNLFIDALKGLKSILGEVAPSLGTFVDEIVRFVGASGGLSALSNLFAPITDYASQFKGMSLGDALVKMVIDAKNALSKIKWEDVIKGLKSLNAKIREVFNNIVDQVKEVGPDIIEGLKNGITESVPKVIEGIIEAGEKLVEAIKALLGIQSPSTVFYEIGVNIVQGLVNGIKYMVGAVVEVANYLIDSLGAVFSKVDWTAVLGIAGGVGLFVILYRVTTALQTFATAVKNATDPLQGAGQVFGGFAKVLNSFGNYINEKKWTTRARAILTVAGAIAVLVGSVFVLSSMDAEGLQRGTNALTTIVGALVVIILALNSFDNALGDGIKTAEMSATFFGIAAVVGVMALALNSLSQIESANLDKAVSALTSMTILTMLLMKTASMVTSGSSSINELDKFFLSLGATFVLMAASVKILGELSPEQVNQGVSVLTWMGILVAALMGVTRLMGDAKQLKSVGDVIKNVGVAFILLGVAIRVIGSTDPGQLVIGLTAITYLTFIIAALMAATRLASGKSLGNVGTTILAVSAAFILMAAAVKILGSMNSQQLDQGTKYIAAFAAIVSALMGVTRLISGGEVAKIGGTILGISVAIGILAAVAIILGKVDTQSLVKGIILVGVLSIIVDGMVMATKNAKDVKGTMIGIAIAIGVLAAALVILSFIDTKQLLGSAVALGIVLLALAAVVNGVSKMKSFDKGMVGNIVVLGLILGAVTGVLTLLSTLDVNASVPNAIALGTLLVALAGAARLMGRSGDLFNKKQLAMIGTLVVAMGLLSGVIAILAQINPQNVLPNTVALSVLLLALSASVKILGGMVVYKPGPIAAVIASVTAAMYALAGLLAILTTFDASGALPNVVGLGLLLAEMTAVTFALSKMGAVDPVMVSKAAVALDAVTGIVGAMVAIVGAINQVSGEGLADLMASGAEVFTKFGEAIGGFLGGIAGGFLGGTLDGLGDGLVNFGLDLSMFMLAIQPFLSGLSNISPDMTTAATNLAGAIGSLTGASFLDGIASFLSGGNNWAGLSEKMDALGKGLGAFTTAVGEVNLERAKTGSEAIKNVMEAMAQVPSTGGFLGMLFGEKDFSGFATGMEDLGDGLSKFYDKTKDITPELISPAANALSTIISTFSSIPNSGGLLQDLLGEANYENFAKGMEQIGDGLAKFIGKVSTIESYDSVNSATTALQTIINTLSTIPTEGGWLQDIFGGNLDYKKFSEGLEGIATALESYSTKAATLDYEKMTNATNRLTTLINMLKNNVDLGPTFNQSVANIKKISDIGDALVTYNSKISSIDMSQLSSSVTSIQRLTTAIMNMVGLDTAGIPKFKAAIEDLAQINGSEIANAFDGIDTRSIGLRLAEDLARGFSAGRSSIAAAVTKVTDDTRLRALALAIKLIPVGGRYVESIAKGMTTSISSITSAVRTLVRAAMSAASGYTSSFYSIGANLAIGFANGIKGSAWRASLNAQAMANAAVKAAKAALDENSPSRVFYAIGEFAGMGLANGMYAYASVCAKAGEDMGVKATDGLNTGIGKISTAFDDLDVNPTIRPVMDLSEVKSGIDYINGGLSGVANIGALTQANRINRAVLTNGQNGTTNDVIHELSKLRHDIQGMPVNQYTVGGITYDDGSNVANSIRELVRATRIERRR